VRTSTITATVTDNRSGPAALKVSFSYTLGGATSTVAMDSAGKNAFRGTLGPLPMPKATTRIPISVVAVDAAGNSARSASPTYVTLANTCTPG
jgi:serine/threonine-protein kinase